VDWVAVTLKGSAPEPPEGEPPEGGSTPSWMPVQSILAAGPGVLGPAMTATEETWRPAGVRTERPGP
jgi:hypothetical protein